jgi:hypothetical protein
MGRKNALHSALLDYQYSEDTTIKIFRIDKAQNTPFLFLPARYGGLMVPVSFIAYI